MPFPIIPAIIAGATAIGGAVVNHRQNKKAEARSRQYAQQDYAQQRKDALADLALQNDYNSPQAQMQRLREANLNPQLVYGSGTTTGQSQQVNPTKKNSTEGRPYSTGEQAMQGLHSFFDTQVKQAQTDNLRTQNTVLLQDALLKAAQTSEVATKTARSKFDLDLASELRNTSVEAAQEQVRMLKGQVIGQNQSNIGAALDNRVKSGTYREKIEAAKLENAQTKARIGNIKADTQGKSLSNYYDSATMADRQLELKYKILNAAASRNESVIRQQMQKIELEMNKEGMSLRDPIWQRLLKGMENDFDKMTQRQADAITKWFGR